MGGRLRAIAASDHPLAPTIKNIMDTGGFVSTELIKEVLRIEISKHP
jgi:adenylate kinase family enzyme